MVFSRYLRNIAFFVILIAGTAVGLGIYLSKPGFPVSTSVFAAMLILETSLLFIYLIRVRKDMLKFVTSLKNEDASLMFTKDLADPYFSDIHKGFNEIIRNFRLIRTEKETEHRFFRATIDHIQFGIIAFDREGMVEFVNQSFRNMCKCGDIKNINDLEDSVPDMVPILKSLEDEQEVFRKIKIHNRYFHLIFLSSVFRLKDRDMKLVSVRDISREIDRNELEAWQKLIRILKHEILNSISPIKLISSGMMDTIKPLENADSGLKLSDADLEVLQTGMRTIHNRATGLSNFLDAYSNLYQVPEPQFEPVNISSLMKNVGALFGEQFRSENIDFKIETITKECSISMDRRLIEQVLINIIKNAIEAVREKSSRHIVLGCDGSNRDFIISVKDNGKGIPPDQLENIFIPFFSTKEKGSGIGLSFSQHVMSLHNGSLKVTSQPGKGSEFLLLF